MLGFIVNPNSGNGHGVRAWQQIERILMHRSIPYKVAYTKAARDAYSYAASFITDHRISALIAVGGDGTLHEVANGIHQSKSTTPLGFIPAGSGNDFARGFGIPMQIKQALELIVGPHALMQADVIRNGQRVAVCSIGTGFDGLAARVTNTASYKKWLNRLYLGKLAYVISLVRVLVTFKPCETTVTIDGHKHTFQDAWLIATANSPHIGGGMAICPEAMPTDGVADICVVSGISKLKFLSVFPRVYKGTHTSLEAAHFLRGKHIQIATAKPLDIHMDGESAGFSPVVLEVLPAAIQVIVPIKAGERS